MKKTLSIAFGLVLVLGLAGCELNEGTTSQTYYDKLRQECEQKNSKNCCLASVERMEEIGAHKVSADGVCDYGYKKGTMMCIDSFAWCEKASINDTSKFSFYQNLRDKCKETRTDENQLSCCLDSVKAMEVVGATKLFPGGKYEESGEYNCGEGLERMALRCPGSYAWCQTLNNPEGEDFVPVPIDAPRIEPNHPEIPGPGFDDDGNGPICTADAKQCPDGTYVGRTGPNCEFAKCPGEPTKPDFVPTEFNQIQLPDNVITEKECAASGGEVWNTLGETSYTGELIGRVDGLKCPCACLVRNEGADKIWIEKNGNREEFAGNLDDIQTFDDCAKAGFAIKKDGESEICTVGEPHMTGGKYKTFYNNPMEAGKTCEDYTYSTCPGSCVAKCTASECQDMGDGTTICTSDCDGPNSCIKKNPAKF